MNRFRTLVAAGLTAGAWLTARPRPLPPTMPGSTPLGPTLLAPGATVSVVVPARNEARNLPTLLRSVNALDPAPHEVIVVDDGSDDGTDDVAAGWGATVVRAPPPPAGWLGKPWACHLGAATATGTHLWFVDADVEVAPDAGARLAEAHRARGGLVSVQPYHRPVHAYEQLSAYCNAIALMASGAMELRDGDLDVAFGPCLFTSVAEYADVGGHAAVRDRIAEDIGLARRFREHGLGVRVLIGADVVSFRMYPDGPRQLWEGWSKNLAAGARAAHLLRAAGTALWVTAHVDVAIHLARALTPRARGDRRLRWDTWLATACVMLQLRRILRHVGRFRWWAVVAFPVPLATFAGVFARSVFLTFVRRRVTWRGRAVSLAPGCPG